MTSAPPLRELLIPGLEKGALLYCDDFVSASEEASLLAAAAAAGADGDAEACWATLPRRRLLSLGGVPHPSGMIAAALPAWLAPVTARLRDGGVRFSNGDERDDGDEDEDDDAPNQVLINEYGVRGGIAPHNDGPLFVDRVAIISLGAPAVLRFFRAPTASRAPARSAAVEAPPPPAEFAVALAPRSAFVFSGAAYRDYEHGIVDDAPGGGAAPAPAAARRRVSLTVRRVRRVASKAGEFRDEATRAEAQRRRAWWLASVAEKPADLAARGSPDSVARSLPAEAPTGWPDSGMRASRTL